MVSEDRLEQRIEALERVFSVAASQDTPGEVAPEYTCSLTMEPFREPVITPAGLSYEGQSLMDHFEKVGARWPVHSWSLRAHARYAGAVSAIMSILLHHKQGGTDEWVDLEVLSLWHETDSCHLYAVNERRVFEG